MTVYNARKSPLALCLLSALSTGALADEPAADDDYVEFNTSVLRGNVDNSRFANGNPVPAGSWPVNLQVNGKTQLRSTVNFIDNQTARATPCLTRNLLEQMNIDVSHIAQGDDENACVVLAEHYTGGHVSYESLTQTLNLQMPQQYLISHPRGWVSPKRWDAGIPMAITTYNLNAWHSENDGDTSDSIYSGLNYGINIGGWRFRASGALNWDSDSGSSYDSYDMYVAHDIDALQAQLELGNVRTQGNMMDSVTLDGVRLYYDDRMNPLSRSFVPVIRGVANNNAKITLKQADRILQQVTVPPGPFAISDYYAAENGSDIDVTVEESDGSIRTFSVPYASVAQLMSPGQSDWEMAAGTVNDQRTDSDPGFAMATGYYGLNNTFTGYAGAQWADGTYMAGLLGVAMNTQLGALAFDVTHSSATLPELDRLTGQSYRLTWSKVVASTDTTFSVAAYRFSSANYLSLSDALSLNENLGDYADDNNTSRAEAYYDDYGRTRNEVQVNIYQPLTINGEAQGSFYVNGTWRSYWGNRDDDSQYGLGYSNSFRWGSYNVSVQRSYNEWGDEDDQLNLSLTIPFSAFSNKRDMLFSSMTATVNTDFDGTQSLNTSITGYTSDNLMNYSLSVASSQNKDSKDLSTVGAWGSYNGELGTTSLSATAGSDSSRQYSLSNNGGIVLHSGGLTLAPEYASADTPMALIHASGARGAKSSQGQSSIDPFGNAIVSNLTPYIENDIGLDISQMQGDVDISNTSVTVVPRSGALVKVELETKEGRSLLLELSRSDKGFIPLGTDVLNAQRQVVGTVGQAGQAYVRGVPDDGTLEVSWGNDAASRCQVHYRVTENSPKVGKTTVLNGLSCQPLATVGETQHD